MLQQPDEGDQGGRFAEEDPMEQELVGIWTQAGVGVGQLALIAWGLRQMSQASADRNRQLDIMEARQEAQSQARQLHPGYAELPGRFGHRDSSALEDAVLKHCPVYGGTTPFLRVLALF